ncbi:MAG: NRDE family protein [Kangiellaceae bacterium]|nr:NRDE family protein [Kangiellaceae bacterium]
MCLVVFAVQQHPDYPLIIAANRDEFFDRPTEPAHYWPRNGDILAGKDNEAGGTWLGINRQGYFSAVTNIRRFPQQQIGKLSRGKLIADYLALQQDPQAFCQQLQQTASHYSPFNLFVGKLSRNTNQLYYFNNQQQQEQIIDQGIHAISNGLLNEKWSKVSAIEQRFEKALNQDLDSQTIGPHSLLSLLRSTEKLTDKALPNTGIEPQYEQHLSSAFIDPLEINGRTYGTRSQTFISINNDFECHYFEIQLNSEQQIISEMDFKLQLSVS